MGDDAFQLGANILLLLPVALIATVFISRLLLTRYRAAVARSMAEAAGSSLPSESTRSEPPSSLARPLAINLTVEDASGELWQEGGSRERYSLAAPLRSAAIYSSAGVVFALVSSILAISVDPESNLTVRGVAILALFIAWPIIPTVAYLVHPRRGVTSLVVLGYIAIIVSVVGSSADLAVADTAASLVGIVVVPAFVGSIINLRSLRAVAPFVFAATLIVGIGFLYGLWNLLKRYVATSGEQTVSGGVFLFFIVFVVAGAVAFYGIRLIARLYQTKRISDQSLVLFTWWLILSLWLAMLMSVAAGWLAFAGLVAWAAFVLIAQLGLRQLSSRTPRQGSVRLLLLRVFGSRRQAEKLLTGFERYWRHVGPIQLLAGQDLATANLEPHEFVEFIDRRLSRRFVRDDEEIAQRLDQMDLDPDPDGRFRINEVFCHADTWRSAITAMADESDVVLTDLRGFSENNLGVVYELTYLLNTMPLSRIVLITDDGSDLEALMKVLRQAWVAMIPESPNYGAEATTISLLKLAQPDYRSLQALIRKLSAAAGT